MKVKELAQVTTAAIWITTCENTPEALTSEEYALTLEHYAPEDIPAEMLNKDVISLEANALLELSVIVFADGGRVNK